MKIEIEIYKGQSIVYNDDNDKFECEIELNDQVRATKRVSLKDARKEIDEFIKVNIQFKPFKFLKKSGYSSKSFEPYVCSAIRTDGKFVVYRDADGNEKYKSYYGEKEMKLAMVFDPEIIKELELLDKEKEEAGLKYNNAVSDLYDRLVPCDLSAYQNITDSDTKEAV